MHFLLTSLVTTILSDADPSPPFIVPHDPIRMQEQCMKDSLATPANAGVGWWTDALRADSILDESCTWRFVQCRSSTVVGLILPWRPNNAFEVTMDLLPQSMEFLHLEFASVLHFSIRDLPQDLKYLYMTHSGIKQRNTYKVNRDGVLDTALLPRNLESASLRFGTPTYKIVLLQDLPQSLNYIFISNEHHINYVLVDNSGIPDSLKTFHVHRARDKVRVREVDDAGVDKRVDVSVSIAVSHNTKYYDEYRNLSVQIAREIGV